MGPRNTEHMNKPSALEIFLGLATPPEPTPEPEPTPRKRPEPAPPKQWGSWEWDGERYEAMD